MLSVINVRAYNLYYAVTPTGIQTFKAHRTPCWGTNFGGMQLIGCLYNNQPLFVLPKTCQNVCSKTQDTNIAQLEKEMLIWNR